MLRSMSQILEYSNTNDHWRIQMFDGICFLAYQSSLYSNVVSISD